VWRTDCAPAGHLGNISGAEQQDCEQAYIANFMTASIRTILRYAIVLLGGIIAGVSAVTAMQAWQKYWIWRGRDPSAADAYLSFATTNSAVVVLSVALAWLLWWLLQPPSPRGGR
jgi:putative flippase GtrA